MDENTEYKMTLRCNPRYIVILTVLLSSFCINLFAFYFLNENFIFLALSILSIGVFSYIVYHIRAFFSQTVKVLDDHIEYKRSRFETDIIVFREITFAGFFKKNTENELAFRFKDGLYVYEEKKDRFLLIGKGFADYLKLYKRIQERCNHYRVLWKNIERKNKKSLVLGLKNLLSDKTN